MIEPLGYGLDSEVTFIAGAACLAARKTLQKVSSSSKVEGNLPRDEPLPKSVRFHSVHETISINLREHLRLSYDSSIGEENIQTSVLGDRLVDDAGHSFLVPGVKLAHMDIYTGVERLHLPLMSCEMGVAEVADIDRLRAIIGELVCGGTTNTIGRVGACE